MKQARRKPVQSKKPLSKRKRLIILITSLIVFIIIGVGVYFIYEGISLRDLSRTQQLSFDQQFTVVLKQPATIKDDMGDVTFRITKLEPAKNPDADCEELCGDLFPFITAEFTYEGKVYKGRALHEHGGVDVSYSSNGAYELMPYDIELNGVDYDANTVNVIITKIPYQRVTFDEPFTVHQHEIAALEPGKTGLQILFGICGQDSPCIRNLGLYVNGQYVAAYNAFNNPKAPAGQQFVSIDGSTVAQDGIQLRLIESDDTTYATFVFEKV